MSRNDVSEGLLRNKTSDNAGFYANKLRPYSRYSLMVYVRNKDGSYNKDLFLNITAKTQPYIPEAPVETKATATSSEVKIFLSCPCIVRSKAINVMVRSSFLWKECSVKVKNYLYCSPKNRYVVT